jgi:rod shape-determining protein MreC
MENLITRHRNVSILVAVLFAQVLGLAVQVKRSANNTEDTRLIRIWAISAVTPLEKALIWMQQGTGGIWHNYVYLRGVRAENRDLKQEIERLRLEQVRLSEDAGQARRLQSLLGFKEKFVSKTVAAQVIGSSGSEQSRAVYIDKGSRDGIEPDQAVITAEGIVGKVLHVYDSTSLVLLINDQTSGVGVILEKSRLHGVLRGTPLGGVAIEKVMNDESVQAGEHVITSGGDQIFPKGLDVGTVSQVRTDSESFLNIRIKPSANLSKLEEVLVVTKIENKSLLPGEIPGQRIRAVDILTQRLPSVPDKPPASQKLAAGSSPTATPKTNLAAPVANGAVPSSKPAIPQVGPAKPNLATGTAPATKPAMEGAGATNTKTNAGPQPATSVAGQDAPGNGATDSGASAAKPAIPNPLKPATATGPNSVPGNVKPAVVQKPATSPKPVAPANGTEEKSAKPATSTPKPEAAPVDDKPQ